MKTMETTRVDKTTLDNSKKRVLARGCDPVLSEQFASVAPALTGGAEYVPTWNDADFIEKLQSEKWSVVYFAPGACRYSAAQQPIPGGNMITEGWSLENYITLAKELQGQDLEIAESPFESNSLDALKAALAKSKEVK
jgi:hypothetical protein